MSIFLQQIVKYYNKKFINNNNSMCLKATCFNALFVTTTLLSAIIMAVPAGAQVIWSSPAGTAWLTNSNWTGGVAPTSTQIAEFDANPTSPTIGVGIDMSAASGSL